MRSLGQMRRRLREATPAASCRTRQLRRSTGEYPSKDAAILERLINSCWFLFKLGLAVLLIGGAAVCAYFYAQMDEEIRHHAQSLLAEKFPAMTAAVGGARRIDGRGIAFYDIVLSAPSLQGHAENFLVIDEVVVDCAADVSELVSGAIDVKRVEVKHPKLWLRRQAGGRWNFESLLPMEPCGPHLPPIVVRGGSIAVSDAHLGGASQTVRDVNLTIEPKPPSGANSPRDEDAAAVDALPSLRVDGAFAGAHIRHGDLQIVFDAKSQQCTANASVQQFDYGPELHAWVAAYLPPELRQGALAGRIDARATVQWRLAGETAPQFNVDLEVSEGRVDHPWLPRPITELHTSAIDDDRRGIAIDNSGVTIHLLRGRSETANVELSLRRNGWGSPAPIALAARAKSVRLNRGIRASLPMDLQDQWDKYLPEGVVDVERFEASFDGRRWRLANVELIGSELSFESDHFPYRLGNGRGTITYTPAAEERSAVVDVNLIGHGGKQPIRIEAQAFDPAPGAAGWARITGQGIEIEQEMIDAIEGKARDVIDSLHPVGKVDVDWRLHRAQPDEEPQTQLLLTLQGVDIEYEEFQYPLENVHGQIRAHNKQWTFGNLATRGRKQIACSGWLRPIAEEAGEGTDLYLNFRGKQIPLDDALYAAVSEQVQRAWEQLRPAGTFDLRSAEVRFRTGDVKPHIAIEAEPRPESAGLKPEFFEYELKNVSGRVSYRDGEVHIRSMRALHEPTEILTNGHGRFDEDGGWSFRFTDLSVDRLTPARRDFLAALPRQLSLIIDQLDPTGTFEISNGTFGFQKTASSIAPVVASWDFLLDCHQTDLNVGLELNDVSGSVQLAGKSNGLQSYCTGQLSIESATIHQCRVTNVQGPFWVDQGQCLLGHYATAQQRLQPQRLRATAYDGVVEADAKIEFHNQPRYEAVANLRNTDLRRLMLERFGSQTQFRGAIDANVQLRGSGRYLEGVEGRGNVHVHDAELYEHSLLVGMLKMLQIKAPDTTAFNQCDVEFRLRGKDVLLDKLNFLGDAVSLYGTGRANTDQQINLAFYGQVGRNEKLPIVKRFLGQVSEQTMRMYVSGTVSDPLVRTEAFPGFNQFIEQVQADLEYPVFGPPQRQPQRAYSPQGPVSR